MNLSLGNISKELPDTTYVSQGFSNIDMTVVYARVFGEYPIYKCDVNVNDCDDDEDVDVYRDIFEDLTSKCFRPVMYDYEYEHGKTKDAYVNRFHIISMDEMVMISYEFGTVSVYTHVGRKLISDVIDRYLKKYLSKSNKSKCYIIVKDPDMYLKDFSIELKSDLDFDLYNEGFESVHKNIVESLNTDRNGLYLLYGAPGTGKTTYIRHLIKECASERRKFVYVPSNLFGDFTNPSLVPFLMDHKGCVFIIEDCESLVTVENGVRSAELTDLLNMTDGLLADALDIKIICTFNIDDGKIDDALLRPGRCRCRYEFDLLDVDRANKVAGKFGLEKVSKDISLADLFNSGDSFSSNKKRKIGFC